MHLIWNPASNLGSMKDAMFSLLWSENVFTYYWIFLYLFIPGRICVPIDPEHCDEFDPTTVPTVAQVRQQEIKGYYIHTIMSLPTDLQRGKCLIQFSTQEFVVVSVRITQQRILDLDKYKVQESI